MLTWRRKLFIVLERVQSLMRKIIQSFRWRIFDGENYSKFQIKYLWGKLFKVSDEYVWWGKIFKVSDMSMYDGENYSKFHMSMYDGENYSKFQMKYLWWRYLSKFALKKNSDFSGIIGSYSNFQKRKHLSRCRINTRISKWKKTQRVSKIKLKRTGWWNQGKYIWKKIERGEKPE